MKKLTTLSIMFLALSFLPSCKKDSSGTTATNNNNNNNNNNNADAGNGLYKLAPATATSYCVLILEGNDTMVWSNIANNLSASGGVEGSAQGDMFFSGVSLQNSLTNNWTRAGFSFQMPEKLGYTQPSCNYIDSMVKMGNVTLSPSNGNYMWLGYSDGTYVESWFNLGTATCQVVSVTNMPSATKCYSLRTRIDISNMDIDFDPFCAVYHTHIVKGEMQFDFNVNE